MKVLQFCQVVSQALNQALYWIAIHSMTKSSEFSPIFAGSNDQWSLTFSG